MIMNMLWSAILESLEFKWPESIKKFLSEMAVISDSSNDTASNNAINAISFFVNIS